ncbi:glycosyltransferase family 4 protein [Sphingobium yanoikuyae]|nr:glycosyltransferase family 4 protein [Sphingobium yanoikuyae]
MSNISVLENLGVSIRRRHVLAQYYSKIINRQLEKLQPDAVVAVAAAHKIAYIDHKWPLIYVADAMYATVVNYYGKYANVNAKARLRGNAIQCALLERADRILLSSQWAADAAHTAYDLSPECLRVVPLGANLDADPGYQPPTANGPVTLLFVGFAWERKGGPLLLEIWRELRRRTGDAELHIVGARPKEAIGCDGVVLHGKIHKSNHEDYQRLVQLYRRSSFMVMPSREEAYGIVYCEAAAFGRPAVAARTGGVVGIIDDDRTGLLLDLEASPADYADRILRTWQDHERYATMCLNARRKYEDRLNWNAWGDGVVGALGEVLGKEVGASLGT